IHRDGAVARGRRLGGAEGSRRPAEGVLDDVELHERIDGPAVDADVREPAAAALASELQVGADLADLLVRLRLVEPGPDAGEEVTRAVPCGVERSARRVEGGHAAVAAGVPEEPALAADGALVFGLATLDAVLELGRRGAAVERGAHDRRRAFGLGLFDRRFRGRGVGGAGLFR